MLIMLTYIYRALDVLFMLTSYYRPLPYRVILIVVKYILIYTYYATDKLIILTYNTDTS